MARIRTIKPEFPQSESMGRISRDARLTFVLSWTMADDSGRLRGNSRMLASLLFPYDNDAPGLIDGWLAELEHEGCIDRYSVDGQSYVQIRNWLNHQKIDKPSASKLPEFNESSRILAKPLDHSSEDQGSRTKDQGPKPIAELPLGPPPTAAVPRGTSRFAAFWAAWPKSPRKVDKSDCSKKWARSNLDAIADRIIAHVEAMKLSQPWLDGFEPAPMTYLNGSRWEDPIPDKPTKSGGTDLWWTSDAGIQRKGSEVGLPARPGETSSSYRDRIKVALDQTRAA